MKNKLVIILGFVLLICMIVFVAGCASEEDKEAALKVDKLISSIGKVSYNSTIKSRIDSAQKAFDALTDVQKGCCKEDDTLEDAVEAYNKLKEEALEKAAKNVDELIGKIGKVSLDSYDAIKKAKDEYDSLDKEALELVKKEENLSKAVDEYDALAIKAAEESINAIGEVKNNDTTKNAISKAENACRKVFGDKSKITNYSKIEEANKKLNEIRVAEQKAKAKQDAQNTIKINKIWVSSPDSAGGVEVHISYTNKSSKTIKYFNFGFELLNGVGDVVTDGVGFGYRNEKVQWGGDTGPYGPGHTENGYNKYWGKYYNTTIKSARLTNVEIEYMDGSSVSYSGEAIGYIQY